MWNARVPWNPLWESLLYTFKTKCSEFQASVNLVAHLFEQYGEWHPNERMGGIR